LRAHTDELQILADKDVTVISVNDEIRISASTKIELIAGQSSITLEGANIEFKTPGAFTVKGSGHAFMGGASGAAGLAALPAGSAATVAVAQNAAEERTELPQVVPVPASAPSGPKSPSDEAPGAGVDELIDKCASFRASMDNFKKSKGTVVYGAAGGGSFFEPGPCLGGTKVSNATPTRRQRPQLAALVLTTTTGLIACGVNMSNAQTSPPPASAQAQPLFGPTKTATSRRLELPEYERSFLPNTGFVLFAGGTVSRANVYVVDVASHMLTAFSAKEMGKPASRNEGGSREVRLDEDSALPMIRLANKLWASESSYANLPPRASFNVRLILVDQGTTKEVDSYGPPKAELKELFDLVVARAIPATTR
jgi:type VI secretion system secreted protein VgrG